MLRGAEVNIKSPEIDPQPWEGSRTVGRASEWGKKTVYNNGYSYYKRKKFVLNFKKI